jgi:predicted lipoprotein with Yx(FWY)xxD motif
MQAMNHGNGGAVVRRGRVTRVVGVVAVTAMLGAVGFLTAGSITKSAAGTSATVALRKTKLGPILVNSKGHTLYLFALDRHGKSACSGSCAQFWPPLLRKSKPTTGSGVKAALLGTTKRGNGSVQLTYNHHPLYSFALDKRAGQTNGANKAAFGAKWHAVSARGTAVVKAPPTTTTTPTTTSDTTTSCYYPPC